jgi:hypothetical protein
MMFNSPFVGKGGSTPPKGFSQMERVLEMINEVLRKELNKIETSAELHEVYEHLKSIQNKIVIRNSLQFNIGDKVEFDSKRGYKVEGTVTKVNQKTIKLTSTKGGTVGTRWNVSANLLRKI